MRLTILDLFPKDRPSIQAAKELQEKFGGFGTLMVIAKSESPEKNSRFIQELEEKLRPDTTINFIEYKTEAAFFNENKLLYISLSDLEVVRDRVYTIVSEAKKRKNPLVVQLVEDSQSEIDSLIPTNQLKFSDLEKKYSSSLKQYLGNEDQTVQLLKIYPDFDVTDVKASQNLFNAVSRAIVQIDSRDSLKVYFAGEIYNNIMAEGKLIDEIKQSAWIPILIIIMLLLFFFYRQPMIPLLTVIPVSIGFIWTLGIFAISKQHLDMTSVLLAIIIIGLGVDSVVHLLSRYGEERRKGLGAEIAFENIILETGPAVTTSSFTTAVSFFCIALIPFEGFRTIGIYGGAGILCIWLSVMLNFPCILILLQKVHVFKVFGKKIYNHIQFRRRPYTIWKAPIPMLVALALFLGYFGYYPQFEYDFDKLGFLNENLEAESLLKEAKEEFTEPAIIITHDTEEADSVLSELKLRYQNPHSTIRRIISYKSLLPSDQTEKIELIDELKEILSPKFIALLSDKNKTTIKKITDFWDIEEITEKDFPQSFRRKFMGRNEKLTQFIFIFPKEDISDGLAARRFAKEIGSVTYGTTTISATGKALLTADFLDLTLPHLGRVLIWSLLLIGLILYIDSKSIKNTLIIMGPVLIGGILFIGILNFFGFKFNSINIIIFPLFLGLGSDATIHLFFRYQEEQSGSLFFVLVRTGSSVVIAIFTSIIGFTGLLFASHGGLYSLGLMAFIAFAVTILITFVLFPVVMGFFDTSRWNKKLKRLKIKDEIESPNPPTFY